MTTEKKIEEIFTDAADQGVEECEECLTLTKNLTDGLCQLCYNREKNLAPGRRQSQEDKDISDYSTESLVCQRCDDKVAQLSDGLCDLCCDELNPDEDATADQPEEENFTCSDCERERKHYAKGLCSSCYQKSLRKRKEAENDSEPKSPRRVAQIAEKKMESPPNPVTETEPVNIAPQKETAEVVPASNYSHPQSQMKSEKEKSEKATPATKVDDKAGVVFTLPKGCVQPLAEIYIHFFERDEGLLEQLNTAADMNRRTLANEILYRLDAAQ